MSAHKVLCKSVRLGPLVTVDIKYWADPYKIYVAGFDSNDKQVTRATYSATVDIADNFEFSFQESLIDGLVRTLETDLLKNPQLHYKGWASSGAAP